jgi:hypothetical protein
MINTMKIQYAFYIVGVIFIFATVIYFVREYIDLMADSLKLVLLLVSIIVTFVVAEILREYDK